MDDINIRQVAAHFGSAVEPTLLHGGRGKTYRSGDVILKPAGDRCEAIEVADIAGQIQHTQNPRVPQPVRSVSGEWISDGFVAWSFLSGREATGRYGEKIDVCDRFSEFFSSAPKPDFIDTRADPWSVADRVAWEEQQIAFEGEFHSIVGSLLDGCVPVSAAPSLVHGDIAGNMLHDTHDGWAVIDLTFYWRPPGFATALLVLDAVAWEGASPSIVQHIADSSETEQLLRRAALRRIVEQYTQQQAFAHKQAADAISQAQAYTRAFQKVLSALRAR